MVSLINSRSEEVESDEVRWSLFAPRECSAGDAVLIQVWLYAVGQEQNVVELARELDAGAQIRVKQSVKAKLSRGDELLVTLESEWLRIDEPEARLTWDGEPASVNFVVRVPEQSPVSEPIPRAILYLNDRPLGHLNFMLRVGEAARPPLEAAVPPPEQTVVHSQRAYLCYARADREEVLKRAQGLQAVGIVIDADKMTFETGERWEEQARQRIAASDMFCIFWSKAAAESAWVRREIECALQLQEADPDKRPRIVPIPLSADVPPPAELSMLSFDDSMLHTLDALEYLKKNRES